MVSKRGEDVSRFIAMDVLERAGEREDVLHLELGEPDFQAPKRVIETAVDALRAGNTDYTATRGKPALRQAIAARYDRVYGVDIDPERIVVTPGSSPGLFLALAALVDPGETVALTDPHYACYPNFVRLVDGDQRTIPLDASNGFRPQIADFSAVIDDETSAVLVNSPANPTGAVIGGETLAGIARVAASHDATVIADEIYHGLAYDVDEHTILEYTDDAVVLDGFSKRYAMTGWRLGWMIVPPSAVDVVNRLAQNVLLCAPNFVQDAGIAALESDPGRLEEIRGRYRERRDLLVGALEDWGLDLGYTPEGAYYVLADVSNLPGTALEVADLLLEEAGVAVTPGVDFGEAASEYLRLSYATDRASIAEAIRRMERTFERFDAI